MFSLFFCSAFVLLDFLILEAQGKVLLIHRLTIFLRFYRHFGRHTKNSIVQVSVPYFCIQFTTVYTSFQGCFNVFFGHHTDKLRIYSHKGRHTQGD